MYTFLLVLHSWWRWAVLVAGLVATVKAWRGWRGNLPWPASGKSVPNLLFMVSVDVQMVLGLVLYGVSPNEAIARANMGLAMHDNQLRFWAVEHPIMMALATALVHIGFGKAKRDGDPKSRYRAAAIFFTLALLCLFIAIPWPGRVMGRPLFRFGLE
jgi:hypothetical protein